MNLNKFLSLSAILVYAFTAQLWVHAFAMHGEAMEYHTWWDHHTSSDGHSHWEKSHHCQKWLSHETKDAKKHTNHLVHTDDSDHDRNSMVLCLTQSEWTLVNDTFAIKIIDIPLFVPPTPQYSLQNVVNHDLFYYIDDPGWWDDVSFAKFLDTHVGSTVMNC